MKKLQGGGVSALGSGGAVAFTKTAATIAATGGRIPPVAITSALGVAGYAAHKSGRCYGLGKSSA